jgi:hypothetical protein
MLSMEGHEQEDDAANAELFHGYPVLESPLLSQQRYVAFPPGRTREPHG